MRRIDRIIIHCSATNPEQDFCAADIDRWLKAKGWSGIGYHYVIKLDGTIEKGRDVSKAGAHAFGYNKRSIGVCYIGGVDMDGKPSDTRTEEQKRAMDIFIQMYMSGYILGIDFWYFVRHGCATGSYMAQGQLNI